MKPTIATIIASIASFAAAMEPTYSPVPANQCCADTGVCDFATYAYQIPIINLAPGSPNTPSIDGTIDLLGDNIGDSPPITGWIGDAYSRFLEMPMYIGGKNSGNDRVGTAYIAYDCTNEIVCAAAHLDSSFLQANPTVSVQQDDEESFIRFGESNRIRQSNSDEFAYIGALEDSNFIIGYEGCWLIHSITGLESITNNILEFHFNTSEGDTVSTGRTISESLGEFVCVTPNCLTETPTASPNNIPPIGLLTPKPTSSPSANPSASPTSSSPTLSPSVSPTQSPTTRAPSASPTQSPTMQNPSASPSQAPSTQAPSASPSQSPSTQNPSASPSQSPLLSPSTSPTPNPTRSPIVGTESPSVSVSPSTEMPNTEAPSTAMPSTQAPSMSPTSNPTNAPSQSPSASPINEPTTSPSNSPSTASPTNSPGTANPSASLSSSPSSSPTCPADQFCVPEYGLCSGACDRCCEGTACVQVNALGENSLAERRCLTIDDICPSTSPTAAPSTRPPSTRIVPPSSPTPTTSPSVTAAPSTRPPSTRIVPPSSPTPTTSPSVSASPSTSSAPSGIGSGLYVPNCFTGSGGPPVCIIDDGTYDLPAATPEWGTLEECCLGFYGWNYDQCMGLGPSQKYFPNWQNVNIADGHVCVLDDGNHNITKGTPKYDDLSACCDTHYGWNLDECNGVVQRPLNSIFYF